MSEEFEALEKRLEKLGPLEQEALAARILENWQIAKGERASPAPVAFSPLFGDAGSASPRSCCLASLSLCSAFAGALVGAAATFLGMTFFSPPKVEIREIVREVRVEAGPASDVKPQPPETQPPETQPPETRLAADSFGDLDSLLAQRQALVRRMARYESNDGSVSSGFVPPRISPQEYRELLRELRL